MRFEKITGKTPEEQAQVQNEVRELRARGKEFLEGEVLKTEKDIKFLEIANQYFQEEFEALGIDQVADLVLEQVHIMEHNAFIDLYKSGVSPPIEKPAGFYTDLRDAIFVDVREKDWHRYRTLFHEIAHRYAFLRASIHYSENTSIGRAGYKIIKTSGSSATLRGSAVNEAVVEKISQDILSRHIVELADRFGFPGEATTERIFSYDSERKILDLVIEKVAEETGRPVEEVWSRIKRGHFTGEMMHLRDIEKAFGRGSLKAIFELPLYDGSNRAETAYRTAEEFIRADPKTRKAILRRIGILGE